MAFFGKFYRHGVLTVLLQYNAARGKGKSLASRVISPGLRINPAQEHS
jgi:hypothetical protein